MSTTKSTSHVSLSELAYAGLVNDSGNWIDTTIEVAAGSFRGEFEALLRAEEFARFRDQLRVLYETLKGGAKFETMEKPLAIEIEGDGKGHFHEPTTPTVSRRFGA